MIYLIDDNAQNQRRCYGASFVDEGLFEGYLVHIERLGKDFDASSLLEHAEIIMMHDTLKDYIGGEFVEGSEFAKSKIEDFVKTRNIPLVNFSDGHNGSGDFDMEGNINNLKKSTFYSRLYDFLLDYKNTGQPELKILAYGKNYKKFLVERDIKSLYNKLSKKSPNDKLSLGDVIPTTKEGKMIEPNYLRSIINIAQPNLGIDYEGVLDYIEDRNITVGNFKQKLDCIFRSISKYGKNAYTWE